MSGMYRSTGEHASTDCVFESKRPFKEVSLQAMVIYIMFHNGRGVHISIGYPDFTDPVHLCSLEFARRERKIDGRFPTQAGSKNRVCHVGLF